MGKPRVVIACMSKKNGQIIKNQLDKLLGDIISFEYISYEHNFNAVIGGNLVLASGKRVANSITKFLMPNTDILVVRRTIHKDNWSKLNSIPTSTKVLVVNDDQEMTIETVSLLYELGIKHLELIPFYPGQNIPDNVNIAITPNEEDLVPQNIKTIINIGSRIIDSSTIFDMLNKLELLNKRTSNIVINHMSKTIPISPGLIEALNYITESKRQLEFSLNVTNSGFISYNEEMKINFLNKKAQSIFNISLWDYVGKSLDELLSCENLKTISYTNEIRDELYNINGCLIVVNKYSLECGPKVQGGVVTLKEFDEIKRLELKFRKKVKGKGHKAKYTFKDIIGNSRDMQSTIEKAKRFADTNSSILIQGESGTGKELLAQAIHNESKRKNRPFVAFNCAALTDSLLESELFGYVEGAFTGAKKYGKPGLFELAHNGTIFLDEIGDISQNVQARLLRVLQEKEVIRVGGTDIIPVDIRVISATNKDLFELVDKGEFRLDLFYRLNILPLKIPPLRQRKEDIPHLMGYFFDERKVNKDIYKDAMEVLMQYEWPGNIRELENCVEYIISTYGNKVEVKDLPTYIKDSLLKKYDETENENYEIKKLDEFHFILKILNDANSRKEKIGRKTICKRLESYGVYLTEQEIRNRLKKLRNEDLIIVGKGRAATRISQKGQLFLMKK